MNCRRAWDRPFLDAYLSHSWCQGDLRKHREGVLFDRERSLLPVTQEAVAIERQKRQYGEEIPTLCDKLAILKHEMELIQGQIDVYKHYIRHGPRQTVAIERRQFVAACPKADCRGFLSTAYKCGTCDSRFCSECREPKEDGHTCDDALVATIREIQRDSRPCPTCGTAISRVSGCDQMFCTQCSTAFSYASGKIVTGVIHNPHYFERMRSLGGDPARQPGDAPCGGWPRWYDFNQRIPRHYNIFLRDLYQVSRHIEQDELPRFPLETDRADNTDLRVRYLLGELSEKLLRQQIQQRDRRRQFRLEVRGPLEIFVISTLELFQQIATTRTFNYDERIQEYRTLIETTVNAPLRSIADRYKLRVPQIDLEEDHRGHVYKQDGYKPVKRKAAAVSSSNAAASEESTSVEEEDSEEEAIKHVSVA
jgi:hypothetical protein